MTAGVVAFVNTCDCSEAVWRQLRSYLKVCQLRLARNQIDSSDVSSRTKPTSHLGTPPKVGELPDIVVALLQSARKE